MSSFRSVVRRAASPRRVAPVLLAALALAACGDDLDNDPPPVETPVAPRIVVVSPGTGSVLPTPVASLVFRVEDAPALSYAITIGAAAPVEGDEAIAIGAEVAVPLTLADGVNTIVLDVDGADATSDQATVVLVVDAEAPPVLELTAPTTGATTYAATADVAGRVLAARPITTATVQVGAATAVALTLTPATGGYTFAGSVALAPGANQITVEATDDRAQLGTATVAVTRALDEVAPALSIDFPRDGQAVRTRRVIVRGTVDDVSPIASITIASGAQQVVATIDADGSYHGAIELAPAMNAVTVVATDEAGNAQTVASSIYYGQRLASGGAHGGAIRGGRLYTWGRNNLGQTGLDYVSHESRTAYCDRSLTAARDIALCKATTVTTIDAICLNPGFVTPTPADSPEAVACRAATRTRRDAVCTAAGGGAPASCATSATANLATACDVAYGVGTPATAACKTGLVCDGAYAAGSPEHASCVAIAGTVPSVFPSPATPYAPVAINGFSTVAAPAAATGTGATFASLGVTFTSVAFNQNASSALDSTGRVWSWGDGGNGTLCLGDVLDRKLPHRVDEFGAAGTSVVAIARGYDHLLMLRSDGSVWSCGSNSVGQLGDGTSGAANNRAVPTRVLGLPSNIIQVLGAAASSYAVTADGQVYAWGRNQYGNLGNGLASTSTAAAPTPALVPGVTDVAMIASGRDHVLAVRADGTVMAWGLNASNQVNGSDGNVLSPVQIADVVDARAVYANGNQGFYEDPAGRLFGWGGNGSGNLGIPEDDDQPGPTSPVFGLSAVLDVGVGALQGFALRGDQVFGWGWSFHGSLGAGTSAIHTWPYRTPLLVQLP